MGCRSGKSEGLSKSARRIGLIFRSGFKSKTIKRDDSSLRRVVPLLTQLLNAPALFPLSDYRVNAGYEKLAATGAKKAPGRSCALGLCESNKIFCAKRLPVRFPSHINSNFSRVGSRRRGAISKMLQSNLAGQFPIAYRLLDSFSCANGICENNCRSTIRQSFRSN
jgi:hypothetical protein